MPRTPEEIDASVSEKWFAAVERQRARAEAAEREVAKLKAELEAIRGKAVEHG